MHAQLSISEMPCHGEISGKNADEIMSNSNRPRPDYRRSPRFHGYWARSQARSRARSAVTCVGDIMAGFHGSRARFRAWARYGRSPYG